MSDGLVLAIVTIGGMGLSFAAVIAAVLVISTIKARRRKPEDLPIPGGEYDLKNGNRVRVNEVVEIRDCGTRFIIRYYSKGVLQHVTGDMWASFEPSAVYEMGAP